MKFYIGLHQPSDARYFDRAFISVNRLRDRGSVDCDDWIMDSGAFTELLEHGHYRASVKFYAQEVMRWVALCGPRLAAAVSQDFMCEPIILQKTGLTVLQHQRATIRRYDELLCLTSGVYVMPVLQGYEPADYVRHLEMYGDRLPIRAYVGVGSICKRNTDVVQVIGILRRIRDQRPDLHLHGFGLKTVALSERAVWNRLYSADSMAWSYAARREGRDQNSRVEARRWLTALESSMNGGRSSTVP